MKCRLYFYKEGVNYVLERLIFHRNQFHPSNEITLS